MRLLLCRVVCPPGAAITLLCCWLQLGRECDHATTQLQQGRAQGESTGI